MSSTQTDRTPQPARSSELPAIPTIAEVQDNPDALRAFNTRVVDEFRHNGGTVSGPFRGLNVLLLTMIGAKSGRTRITPLEYFESNGRLLLFGTFGGAPTNPAWVHNLRANAHAHVEVGHDAYDVTAHELPESEGAAVFADIASGHPHLAGYPTPPRTIPVFELVKSPR
ncbi:nitroreductase/quinone reductase family protein [Mycolicibacterium hippocampi]|uniref:Deazaflavin-dependent nitroreductase n=1 Tax=Mycolicibacterium hippocampi TaxID=659824 RepID=A0A850PL78_9MYCO|nr:nitroreductase/quinone reductase family protein [Mycolicibacterium hippocampi]NVN49303.1 hypothetical protein [Mycolicibacterium hippocampi]